MENFTGTKPILIEQDILSTIYVSNLAADISRDVEKENEEKYKKDPSSNSDQTPELVAISFKTRMIGIFHTGTGEELKAVFCYNTDYMTKRTQNHLKNNKSYEN